MKYTVEVAALKACPLKLEQKNPTIAIHCVGPECMAWRWEVAHEHYTTPEPEWLGHCGVGGT